MIYTPVLALSPCNPPVSFTAAVLRSNVFAMLSRLREACAGAPCNFLGA
jgi:hypothetical protein